MKEELIIRTHSIQCDIELHIVRIFVDDKLNALLVTDAETATAELVSAVKATYHLLYHTDFEVSDASMMVEIWGHLYVEKVAEAIKEASPIEWIDNLADKVIQRSARIDIGEKGHDNNRFFWDGLCHLKPLIVRLLPGKE